MKYNFITKVDDKWHPMKIDMPPMTTDVEFLKPDGTIVQGEIVVDMAGFYVYNNSGWGSLDDYTHWRFIKDKKISSI